MLATRLFKTLSLALILLGSNPIHSRAEDSNSKVVDNVLIYLGVMPGEMLSNLPAGDEEKVMHGGIPSDKGIYHIMIALFDAKTSERISDAEISASTSEFGMARESKKLEPMKIADTVTFGNFFKFKGNGSFRLDLSILIPGRPGQIKARFDYSNE